MKKLTPVFTVSVIFTAIFILWGLVPKTILPKGNLDSVTASVQGFILEKFGWFYLLSASIFLIFSILLAFSKYGNIRLGKDADRPEYSYLSWFAMLFSAGMGIGLVFGELRSQCITTLRHLSLKGRHQKQQELP